MAPERLAATHQGCSPRTPQFLSSPHHRQPRSARLHRYWQGRQAPAGLCPRRSTGQVCPGLSIPDSPLPYRLGEETGTERSCPQLNRCPRAGGRAGGGHRTNPSATTFHSRFGHLVPNSCSGLLGLRDNGRPGTAKPKARKSPEDTIIEKEPVPIGNEECDSRRNRKGPVTPAPGG